MNTFPGSPLAPPTSSVRRRAGYWWLALSAVGVAVLAVTPYLVASLPALAEDDAGLASNFVDRGPIVRGAFYVHLTFAGAALLISPLQFSARARNRLPRLHRAVGRALIAAIVVGGTAGVVISTVSPAGLVGTAGFGLLGVLWIGFALTGLRAIVRRDVAAHRRWMVRTFALTYAGVMLRLWTSLLMAFLALAGIDDPAAFDRGYLAMPFLSWVPNLLLAEWLLRRDPDIRRGQSMRVTSKPDRPQAVTVR